MTDDEIMNVWLGLSKRSSHIRLPIREFARTIEAETLERAAKACEERGERNRIAAGLPNGDRDEFYCADDIRRLQGGNYE